MIKYNIINPNKFEYRTNSDIDVDINVYVKDEIVYHTEVKMKKNINYFTESWNSEDKKVLITDKNTQKVYCEFEIEKEWKEELEDKYAYSYGEDSSWFIKKYKKTEFFNGLRPYRTFILNLLRLTNCKSYLELGIEYIDNLSDIEAEVDFCVGVDIIPLEVPEGKKFIFHNMTTDNFFEQNKNNFDIIFIDADHRYEQVMTDFENSLKVLNEFGIIMFHDTDPIDERLLDEWCCADSYKIIDYIHMNYPELNVMTFPFLEAGMTFVMRQKDRRINKFL